MSASRRSYYLVASGLWIACLGSSLTAQLNSAEGDPRSPFTHPVLEHGLATSKDATPEELADYRKKLETPTKEILSLTDEQLMALIPDQTPGIKNDCPVGPQEKPHSAHDQPVDLNWGFDPLKPNQVTCPSDGSVFPNDKYPMNQSEIDRNMLGEDITVPYYATQNGNTERRYYFKGVVDRARMKWLLPHLAALGQHYLLTHDEHDASVVIRVLNALAEKYPHYLLVTDYGARYTTTLNKKFPYGYVDTRWGRRAPEDLPRDLLEIFDMVASSKSMDGTRKKAVLEGLFYNPMKRVYPISTDGLYGNETQIPAMIQLAKVLESPELIHEAYHAIQNLPRYASGSDGMFTESPGYSTIFMLSFFTGARSLDGYSDPEGYVGSDGLHLQNIHPLQENEEYFRTLVNSLKDFRLPNGGYITMHDSGSEFGPLWWSGYGAKWESLQKSRNILFPSFRYTILGAGAGDKQIQAILGYGESGTNHGHQEGLALQLFAFGHYLLDNFPYHKSILRKYGDMAQSHNTVIINQQNQNGSYTDGDVEFYAPLMDGVTAVRVDDSRAYAGLAKQYTRTLVLNSIDPDAPYVIDVFEVAGGTLHDYLLRSSCYHHETLDVSIPTDPVPGDRPLMPSGEVWNEPQAVRQSVGSGYGLFFNIKHALIPPTFHFTYTALNSWVEPKAEPRIVDQAGQYGAYKATPASWPDNPPVGTRHYVTLSPGYELFTAMSPSLYESGFYGSSKPTEQWPLLPNVILRHVVKKGEKSVFVVVHEPFHHAPKIKSVKRIDTGDDNLVGLSIELPDRKDTFVYALDKPRKSSVGGLQLDGRLALVSQIKDQKPQGYLAEGTSLSAAGVDLKAKTEAYTGTISAMERSKSEGHSRFCVGNIQLPSGEVLRGSYFIVHNGHWTPKDYDHMSANATAASFDGASQAFPIESVQTENGQTWVTIKGDHGLMMHDNSVEEFYFPARVFDGPSSFSIPTAITTNPMPLPPAPAPLVIDPASKPGGNLNAGVWAERFIGTGDDMASLKIHSEKPTDEISAQACLFNSDGSAVRFTGFLQVPKDGIYTFYAGGTKNFRLKLNQQPVIEQMDNQNLMPDLQDVRLKAGYYPLSVECYFNNASNRIPGWVTVDWKGPDLPRQDITKSCWYSPLVAATNTQPVRNPSEK